MIDKEFEKWFRQEFGPPSTEKRHKVAQKIVEGEWAREQMNMMDEYDLNYTVAKAAWAAKAFREKVP